MRTISWYTEDKEGGDVARLQKALIAQALLAGPADGRFDWRTRMAVVAFQARHGLTADGIVGPQTLVAIEQVNAPAPASTAVAPSSAVVAAAPSRKASRSAMKASALA